MDEEDFGVMLIDGEGKATKWSWVWPAVIYVNSLFCRFVGLVVVVEVHIGELEIKHAVKYAFIRDRGMSSSWNLQTYKTILRDVDLEER